MVPGLRSNAKTTKLPEQPWRASLQSMFPPGVPIPDDESLEYSFATVYSGPPPAYDVPQAQTLDTSRRPLRRNLQAAGIVQSSRTPARVDLTPRDSSSSQTKNPESNAIPVQAFVDPESSAAGVPGDDTTTRVLEDLRANSSESAVRTSSATSTSRTHSSSEANTQISPRFSGSPSFASSPTAIAASRSLAVDSPSNPAQDDQTGFSRESGEQTSADRDSNVNQKRRKGECHGCSKCNRLQERETCLVCNAKFCSSCVLKAMGSMPEGRKCVGCISQAIDESKRPNLGKPSRLLNRLLSTLEVQQIMKAERECPANQLRPEKLYVNGQQLTAQEFAELLGCSQPPLKLKPGRYWYDKQSGLWGKEGEKPDRIITPALNVGGDIQEKASDGCTDVYMNGREITKIELRLLKFAGVQCPPGTHLWVYPDGTYQEEGQNNFRGNIWGKATARFLYSLFSLPTHTCNSVGSKSSLSSTRSVPAYLNQKRTYKLLLLGHEGSGTSTIFKQVKFLYKDVGFTQEELQSIKMMIQRNIYQYISILLEGRERFEEEEAAKLCSNEFNDLSGTHLSTTSDAEPSMLSSLGSGEIGERSQARSKNPYTFNEKLKIKADWFLEIMANGHLDAYFPAATREYAPLVEEMWKDPAIQATYRRKNELHMLPDVAGYFLERVVDVSSNDYEPTNDDILYAEGVTQGSGLEEVEFSLDERSAMSEAYDEKYDESSVVVRYHLIRINAQGMIEGRKWLEMFEDIRAVIFCVALDEYDQMWTDGSSPLQNKLLLSRDLFATILKHPCFLDIPVVLLLNKYDSFEEKINTVPVTVCEWFSDFDPVKASHYTPQVLAQQAYTYIAHKFKHFETINVTGHKLFTFQLRAQDRSSVDSAFQYVKEILKWEEHKETRFWSAQDSIYTTDLSSFSPPVPADAH